SDPPIDDDVVARSDAGVPLLEILLEACNDRQTPIVAISARIPNRAQGVDQRPEAGPAIVRRAGTEAARCAPDRELKLVVEIRCAAVQRDRRDQDVAE